LKVQGPSRSDWAGAQ